MKLRYTEIEFLKKVDNSLEPFLDLFKLVHWDGIYHSCLLVIVFEHEYHIKVLELELHSFKVDKLNFIQSDYKRRLTNYIGNSTNQQSIKANIIKNYDENNNL